MVIKTNNTFQKIILAVDGSEHSLAATNLLNNLPLASDCSVCVISVLDTPHTPRRQLLLAALEQASNILKEKGRKVEYGLLHGHPASSIIEFADHYEPNLIVMGAKGLRATLGILLGGVAQQVIEHAHWPVLIVRPDPILLHQILIAVDGSEYSQSALEYLANFLSIPDVSYHLVHVVSPIPAYDPGNIPRTWQIGTDIFQTSSIFYTNNLDELRKKDEAKGISILDQASLFLEQSAILAKPNLLHGDAATEILEYSKNNMIDIIVAGSRGLSEVSGWLLGSVSRKLVHYAPCSVLIVKQRLE